VKELAKGETVSRSGGVLVIYFCSNTYNGFAAVSFQFSLIGNDYGAAKLLEDLDEDPDIGEYIDILPVEFDLERRMEDRWYIVCHNLLFSHFIDLKRPPH